jgi:hypothetical protein
MSTAFFLCRGLVYEQVCLCRILQDMFLRLSLFLSFGGAQGNWMIFINESNVF